MRIYSDTFDRANGALGSVPNGPAWEILSGTFAISGNLLTSSTAPGSNPIACIDTGVRSNGKADIDVSAVQQHNQGNALYFRVVDVNNWWRVRTRYYSYQYYNTEYQHTTYTTEYEWTDYYTGQVYVPQRRMKQWQNAKQQWWVDRQFRSYTAWSGWSDTGVGGDICRASAPSHNNTPVQDSWGNDIQQYQTVARTAGCASGQAKYYQQTRTRTGSTSGGYMWVDMPYTLVWTNTQHDTGSSTYQTINDGGTYYADTKNSTYDYETGGYLLVSDSSRSNYTVYRGRYGIADDSPTSADDAAGTTATYNNGNFWHANASTAPSPGDVKTGATRQVASGTYWSSTYLAGAPTRQVGPYTDYSYTTYLERNVAGTVTAPSSYSWYGSPIRVVAQGNGITVYLGGTLAMSVTDSTHMSAGKVGLGGAPSDITATPSWNNFSVTLLSPYMVKKPDGNWINRNPLYFNGTSWIETDPRKF